MYIGESILIMETYIYIWIMALIIKGYLTYLLIFLEYIIYGLNSELHPDNFTMHLKGKVLLSKRINEHMWIFVVVSRALMWLVPEQSMSLRDQYPYRIHTVHLSTPNIIAIYKLYKAYPTHSILLRREVMKCWMYLFLWDHYAWKKNICICISTLDKPHYNNSWQHTLCYSCQLQSKQTMKYF